jgi:hypothetical protein
MAALFGLARFFLGEIVIVCEAIRNLRRLVDFSLNLNIELALRPRLRSSTTKRKIAF